MIINSITTEKEEVKNMKKNIKKLATLTAITGIGLTLLASCGASGDETLGNASLSGNADTNEASKTVIKGETIGLPAPFIVTNDDDSLDGYDIAVVKALFELDSFKNYELDLQVSESALIDAQQGVVDFTVNNWSYNEDRAASYYFSYPYTKSRYSILTKKGEPIDSFEALAESDLTVFGGAGGNTTNAIERWNENNPDQQINIEYTSEDFSAKFQKIGAGGYAEIHDNPVLAASETAYPELFEQIETTELSEEETVNITESTTSHLLFGKTSPRGEEYQKLFSEGIYELYQNGTLQKLSDQYIGSSASVVPDENDFKDIN